MGLGVFGGLGFLLDGVFYDVVSFEIWIPLCTVLFRSYCISSTHSLLDSLDFTLYILESLYNIPISRKSGQLLLHTCFYKYFYTIHPPRTYPP